MRGENNILHRQQWRVLRRFLGKHVQRGCGYVSLLQGVRQCRFLNQFTACAVHQPHPAFHFFERIGVDHTRRLRRKPHVQRQVIGDGIDLFDLHQADALFLCHACGDERVVRNDFHTESARAMSHFHADPAQPYNPQRLAP